MKLAKKLLALVAVLALVFSLAVSAAAEVTPSADATAILETDGVIDKDGDITVDLYFINAIGLTSFDFILTYDPAVFVDVSGVINGKDADQVLNCATNSYTTEFNKKVAGEVQYKGYFKEALYPAAEFAENAAKGRPCIVNSDRFHAATFYLSVADAAIENGCNSKIEANGPMVFKGVENPETKSGTPYAPQADIPANPFCMFVYEPAGGECEHEFGEWTVVKEATCTEAGSKTRTCSKCDKVETVVIPALGHSFGEWIIDKAATETEEGAKHRVCSVCGEKEEAVIPKLVPVGSDLIDTTTSKPIVPPAGGQGDGPGRPGGKPGEGYTGRPGGSNKPHRPTGDSAVLAAAAGVILLAGAAFVVSKKRK